MLSITSMPMLTTTCQLWVCADGTVTKFKGDVQAYKVGSESTPSGFRRAYLLSSESHCQQHQSTTLKMLGGITAMYSRSTCINTALGASPQQCIAFAFHGLAWNISHHLYVNFSVIRAVHVNYCIRAAPDNDGTSVRVSR